MDLAMLESARLGQSLMALPVEGEMEAEAAIRAHFQEQYGRDAGDVEGLVEVFFPRR